jgi:hypothetical protein
MKGMTSHGNCKKEAAVAVAFRSCNCLSQLQLPFAVAVAFRSCSCLSQLQWQLQLPFAVAVAVAFQIPVDCAVAPGSEAGKVRRLSERSAA